MDNYKGLTQDMIKDLFLYCEDGYLIWKKRFGCKRAGTLSSKGYRNIGITLNSKIVIYKEHRLIYLYHNGFLSKEIDHINGQRDDNRIDNLRVASHSENQSNARVSINNISGYKGVYRKIKKNTKWAASITANGKRYWLGHFKCKKEAAKAYNEAAVKYHGKFARLNEIQGGSHGKAKNR